MSPARITVGSTLGIGRVTLATDLPVRGEGGPYDPRLIFRLNITLDARPVEQMLTLLDVSCSLHLTRGNTSAGDHNQVGGTVRLPLMAGFNYRTLPYGPNEMPLDVRVPVTPAIIVELERHRHADPEGALEATLRLGATVAWMTRTGNNVPQGPDGRDLPNPLREAGLISLLAPLWTSQVDDLPVRIPASSWVERVLPGLGLDRLRLLEIALPARGGFFPDEVITYFDAARRNFDLGHYREAMANCRDVRNAIEKQLGATEKKPVGDIVAERLALGSDAPQKSLLNAAWAALRQATNEAHHIPGGPRLSQADARACLHLTAVTLEYLGQLLR